MVTPRWLREHRRAHARAASPAAVAATVADVLRHNLPGREPTLDEITQAQGVKPFNWEEFRRQDSGLKSEDWAELRAALGIGNDR